MLWALGRGCGGVGWGWLGPGDSRAFSFTKVKILFSGCAMMWQGLGSRAHTCTGRVLENDNIPNSEHWKQPK